MKIGIVVSHWYWNTITGKMLECAQKAAETNNVQTEVIIVPGSYDIPLGVKILLKKKDIDGIITLGAVVQGETYHDIAIMNAVVPALTLLSLEFEKPVMLGINGPRITKKQAVERIPRAGKIMFACIQLVKKLK